MSLILSILFLITALYTVMILWARQGLRRLSSREYGSTDPTVTIVVAARNEEDNLPTLLEAILALDYPEGKLQLIIVDDGSTDKTAEILSAYQQKISWMETVHIDRPPEGWSPKKWGLSQALEKARHDIVLTTDADCNPGLDWVRQLVRPFTDPAVGMVMGPAPLIHDRPGLWWHGLRLDSNAQDALAAGGLGQGVAITCTGRNLGYRRELFFAVGGYDGVQHFISGDDDLLMHKFAGLENYRIEFVMASSAAVPSPPPPDMKGFVLQRIRFASKGMAYYGLPTSPLFRAILPLIYLTNVGLLVGWAAFALGGSQLYLVPYLVKLGVEWSLIRYYCRKIDDPFSAAIYFITSLIHPLYIVIIGALGSFLPVKWKGREYEGNIAVLENGKATETDR